MVPKSKFENPDQLLAAKFSREAVFKISSENVGCDSILVTGIGQKVQSEVGDMADFLKLLRLFGY